MRKSAFTLLEILIIIGIISIVLLLGVWGMNSLKRTVQLQQSGDELLATVKETRSLAENNVIAKGVADNTCIYAYKLSFSNNQLIRSNCSQPIAGANNWNCTSSQTCVPFKQESLKSDIFSEIIYDQGGTSCTDLIFVNLTGDILASLDNGINYNVQNCQLQVHHSSQQAGRILTVDALNNTFKME